MVYIPGFRVSVQGLGRVMYDLGFRVEGLLKGFKVWVLGFRVEGLGLKIKGIGYRV